MSCECEFEPASQAQRGVLVKLLAINGAMFVAEIAVGVWAQSSGVIADSLDMLADALVYGVGLYAIGRAGVIKRRAARWAGCFQLLLATSIVADVIRRVIFGSEPHSTVMMAVSTVALGANAYCFWLLRKHREGEVHMRASWIFTRTDVIANLGVIVAGLLVRVTDSRWPDLIVGAAIAAIVIRSGFEILAEANRDERTERQKSRM